MDAACLAFGTSPRRTFARFAGYFKQRNNAVSQLPTELDGVGTDNEGVFVRAATNHRWDVDTRLEPRWCSTVLHSFHADLTPSPHRHGDATGSRSAR
jgi:hypothetical protein